MNRVDYRKEGHVAYVTLNRPQVLNAMDQRTHRELAGIWDDVEADPDVRVAVLGGAGDRAFSVGQDLHERARLDSEGASATTFGSRGRPGWPRLTERFGFVKPIVARVDGYALGGGFELVLACDIVVASDRAVFGLPEATLGLVPGAGGGFRLSRKIPVNIAMGYLLTGRRMSARTALEFGLVNEVVAPERLDDCVGEWTRDLIRSSPSSIRAIKESVLASLDMPLERAFATRYEWEEKRLIGHDRIEGPRAFSEHRSPKWTDW